MIGNKVLIKCITISIPEKFTATDITYCQILVTDNMLCNFVDSNDMRQTFE